MKSALIIPDCHIPFESTNFDLMLQIARTLPLSEIVILGDFLDLYGLSFYDHHPEMGDVATLYDREIECGNVRLDELDELAVKCRADGAPRVKKIYLEGNHEYRLKKFLNKNARALANRIKIPDELRLADRGGWKWIPFTKVQSHDVLGVGLYARHCPPAGGSLENSAKQAGTSCIYGHTHAFGIGTFSEKLTGTTRLAINAGWLGDDTEMVFDYVQGRPNWTQGFVFVHAVGSKFWIEPVKFFGKKAVFRGQVFK